MKIFLVLFALGLSSPALASKTLVIIGDSLTEGYGIPKSETYPALVEKKLAAAKLDWKVINSGISGSTSASAPSRTKWALQSKPDALLLALGANDGLRGLPTDQLKKNLQEAIALAKEKKVKVFLAGMEMPPNYGADYRAKFRAVYAELAKEEKLDFLPFLLDKVGGIDKLNQDDRIHPNEAGHKIVAETVFQFLRGRL